MAIWRGGCRPPHFDGKVATGKADGFCRSPTDGAAPLNQALCDRSSSFSPPGLGVTAPSFRARRSFDTHYLGNPFAVRLFRTRLNIPTPATLSGVSGRDCHAPDNSDQWPGSHRQP